jgi:hypothetical protein
MIESASPLEPGHSKIARNLASLIWRLMMGYDLKTNTRK